MKIFLEAFVGALFPRICFNCGAEGEWFCTACRAALPAVTSVVCPGCGASTAHGETCTVCKSKTPLDGLTTFFEYQNNPGIAALIQALKYRRARDVATAVPKILDPLLSGSALARLQPLRQAVLVPVPLHNKRFQERGFNQSDFIANSLGKSLGLSVIADGLKRQRNTAQQMKLNKTERKANVQDAFVWQKEKPPEAVLLVDDVYTTGATMAAAASALKAAGTKFVWGVAIARD